MAEFFQPLRGLFEYVNELPTSIAIRESQYFSPYLTVSHVVVMALVAGLVLMMLPTLIAYLFLQKHLTKGITAGAIKG